jgi:hypothetical protein
MRVRSTLKERSLSAQSRPSVESLLPPSSPFVGRIWKDSKGSRLCETPSFVLKLSGLTPADFAIVVRRANALAEHDPGMLTLWLENEAQAKPQAGQRRIGF